MKIHDIEVEEAPFSDEYLDECLQNIDVCIDLNFAPGMNDIKAIEECFDTIEAESVGKIIYIHYYPKELRAILGVKINYDNFNKIKKKK